MGLAQREMRHLHRVNQALVVGGRAPALGRVSSVGGGSTPDVPLGSPTVADLERVVDRERGIASAVDARFARLRLVVEARDPVLEGELFEHVSDVVGGGTSHSGSLDAFEEPLEGLSPSAFLHATCREPAHELERRLLALSDQQYATIVATVRVWFTREDAIHSDLFIPAMAAMDVLDAINGLLVERGVLPAFTAPR